MLVSEFCAWYQGISLAMPKSSRIDTPSGAGQARSQFFGIRLLAYLGGISLAVQILQELSLLKRAAAPK